MPTPLTGWSDPHASAQHELEAAIIAALGLALSLALAYAAARAARRVAIEDKRTLYAEIDQRDRRIGELERALKGARFEGRSDAPPADMEQPESD